jgi:DNA mismatch endonuclease, patch repair protein
MVDVVDKVTRSRMMSGISGKDTKPEILIRSLLYRAGFRFRVHAKGLPGKPDIVLKKYRAIVFVHGCFWHRHACPLFKWPSSNANFWKAKISQNKKRDAVVIAALRKLGWRILIIWECALKGAKKIPLEAISQKMSAWLQGDNPFLQIRGSLTL